MKSQPSEVSPEVTRLVLWIAGNVFAEPLSGLFLGGPTWNVRAERLLDAIADIWKLDKDTIGEIVNPFREQIEAGAHQ